jgi:type IV pilus biogenesis protein PilP
MASLSSLNTRQKGIIVAFIVIIAALVWQVMGIMGGGSKAPLTTPTANKNPPAASSGNNSQPPPAVASNQPEVKQVTVQNEPQFLKLQKMTEEKYVGKMNELEDLRIQRQIAETNQAIAAAKLATVTAEKGISDLLTRPMTPAAPISSFSNELVTPTTTSSGSPPAPVTPPEQPQAPPVDYTLISVSMQLNKWSAVLGYQNGFFNVSVGDVLPVDGSTVTSITKNNITLKKEGKTRKLNIVSSI